MPVSHVVFNTAFIGDLLLSIPFMRRIKRLRPGDELVLICRPGLGGFFQVSGLVDEVIELDKKNTQSVQKMLRALSDKQIHFLFCPHESYRSAYMVRKIKAKVKVSYRQWWNAPFFDERVRRPMYWPEALRALALLEPYDEDLSRRLEKLRSDKNFHNSPQRDTVEIWPHKIASDLSLYAEPQVDVVRSVLSRFQLHRPFAVIAPASQWATKRWTEDGFVNLIHLLSERGLNVYLVGTLSEADLCMRIEKTAGAISTRIDVRSIAGQTNLVELHALLSMAEVIVTNDSGSMHMGAAAGRPVVAVFGPTTLDLGYRPWSDLSCVVQLDLPCRPCGRHGHNRCPIGTHECMKKITPEMVISLVDRLRQRSHPAGAIVPSQIY